MNEDTALHSSARPNRPPNFDWMGGSLIENNHYVKNNLNSRRASSAALWLEDIKFGVQHLNQMGEIIISPNKYQLMLDVQHFLKPEIEIKASRHAFFVKAAHNVPKEGHDYVIEHFYREYVLPKAIRPNQTCAFISPQNILVIEAPKIQSSMENLSDNSEFHDDDDEVIVPVIQIDNLEQIIPV